MPFQSLHHGHGRRKERDQEIQEGGTLVRLRQWQRYVPERMVFNIANAFIVSSG